MPKGQIRQGDAVRLGEHSEPVEGLAPRYARRRDYDHFVSNGTISTVIDMSRGDAQPVG